MPIFRYIKTVIFYIMVGNFILLYLSLGVVVTILINTLLWYTSRPTLPAGQSLVCCLIWMWVVCSLLNLCTGHPDGNETGED